MAHDCHATNCTTRVPPKLFACKKHWFEIPKNIRDRIWATYEPGQENSKRPSREYLIAARAAIVFLAEKEDIEPDTKLYDLMLKRME